MDKKNSLHFRCVQNVVDVGFPSCILNAEIIHDESLPCMFKNKIVIYYRVIFHRVSSKNEFELVWTDEKNS